MTSSGRLQQLQPSITVCRMAHTQYYITILGGVWHMSKGAAETGPILTICITFADPRQAVRLRFSFASIIQCNSMMSAI